MNDQQSFPGIADLHMHSRSSDGEWAPERLVRAAMREGLETISLTDHDTVAGLGEASEAGAHYGIEVLAGVEISTWLGFDLHLLAYGFDPLAPDLSRILERSRVGRRERAERMVERLAELGLDVSMKAVLREAKGAVIARPHLARALWASGHVTTIREAFDRYLGDGKPACVEKVRIDPGHAMEAVHRAGGVAVCAHPGTYGGPEFLDPLVEQGLDGLEVMHSLHGTNSVRVFEEYAESRGLAKTGGSDFHGPRSNGFGVGSVSIPRPWLEDLKGRIESRRNENIAVAEDRFREDPL